MMEAEVITLGYLSDASARQLWDIYLETSDSYLREMKSDAKENLFRKVHSVCRGNIPDMKRMVRALELGNNADFELALARTIFAPNVISPLISGLYEKPPEKLSVEENAQLAVLQALLGTENSFLSITSLPLDYIPAMNRLLKDNVLSVFYETALPYDTQQRSTGPLMNDGPFPILTFNSIFARLLLEEKAAKRMATEQEKAAKRMATDQENILKRMATEQENILKRMAMEQENINRKYAYKVFQRKK